MVPKRPFFYDRENGERGPAQDPKRFKSAVKDVMGMLTMSNYVSRLEPWLREVVRDEVEQTVLRVLQSSSRTSFDQTTTSGGRGFMLHFVNKLPSTIFTGSKVEGEDGEPLRLILMDANSKAVITSGPLSCLKIELLVLDGDFGSDEHEHWSENEFTASIIREREGRRPLVTGELIISLRDGVGQIYDVAFTDNSSWQRSRKFRLGAKVAQRIPDEVRIREGRTEAFMVKDHRGELYKKHHPPHLDDEIWRLERIAKGGPFHRRMDCEGIRTVRDFLQLSVVDPSKLRHVLGCGISNRIWATIMEHASSCVLDDGNLYTYYVNGLNIQLFFNSVYKVVGVSFDGQNYLTLNKLSPPQKVLVENSKRQAYENVRDFILVDTGAGFGPANLLASLQEEPFQGPNLTLQQITFPAAHGDHPEMQLEFNNSSGSTSYGYELESSSQMEVSAAQRSQEVQLFHPTQRNSFKFEDVASFAHTAENNWSPDSWTVGTSGQLTGDQGVFELQTSTWSPVNSTWGQGNILMFPSGNEGDWGLFSSVPNLDLHMARNGRPRAGWCKLRAALRWRSVLTARRLCSM